MGHTLAQPGSHGGNDRQTIEQALDMTSAVAWWRDDFLRRNAQPHRDPARRGPVDRRRGLPYEPLARVRFGTELDDHPQTLVRCRGVLADDGLAGARGPTPRDRSRAVARRVLAEGEELVPVERSRWGGPPCFAFASMIRGGAGRGLRRFRPNERHTRSNERD